MGKWRNGIRATLRSLWGFPCAGSTPVLPTNKINEMLNEEVPSPNPEILTGEQSQITSAILQASEQVQGEGEELANNIAKYLSAYEFVKTPEPVFARTAEEIVKSGFIQGCNEAGVVFASIMRAKGEDVAYIQAFLKQDVIAYDPPSHSSLSGHVFLRQTTPEGDRFINSTSGSITDALPEKYVFGAEGLDSWDIGLRDGFRDYIPMFQRAKEREGL